jgi:hemolysin III
VGSLPPLPDASHEPTLETSLETEPDGARPAYGPLEELVHALTHGLGAILALAVLATLVAAAAVRGGPLHVATASVFGASLLAVYVSSTIYHAIPPSRPRAKVLLQILDHAAIHLLIAGTYTPIVLVGIGGAWGVALAATAWSLAVVGIVVETTPLRHRTRLSMGLYLGAGWLGAVAVPFLWSAIPGSALALLVLGGVAYTAGVPFFLVEGRRWMHAAWHGFVLAGSALHVGAVALVLDT